MTYVANEDFPLPICDNVRASIVNYTDRNCVNKETFQEIIDRLIAAIEDLDRRVTALERGGDDPYDPINEQIILDEGSIDEQTESATTNEIIPVDVDEEN